MEDNKKEIVVFLGRAGAGKDYQANLLIEKGYHKLAFANVLRQVTAKVARIPYKQMMANYNNFKKNDIFPNYTGRQLMENIGAAIRLFEPEFWVYSVLTIIQGSDLQKVCISDCRYLNEYYDVKEFAEKHDYKFKAIFCDYRSPLYQEHNEHESAALANELVARGMTDLQEIPFELMEQIRKEREE